MLRAVLLAAAFSAAAVDPPPARVERSKGELAVLRPGGRHFEPLKTPEGTRLDPGDRLRTLETGRAHLGLPLRAMALLKSRTTFGLAEVGSRSEANLYDGDALIVVRRPMDRGWAFTLWTPAAEMEAKGRATDVLGVAFWAYSAPDKSTRVVVLRGIVKVRAEGRAVWAKPGQQVRVLYGKEPEEPRPAPKLPADFTSSFAIGGSLSGAEPVVDNPPLR